MAITVKSSATYDVASSLSTSFTCSGLNRLLILVIGRMSGEYSTAASNVKYGGISMTQITNYNYSNVAYQSFYLVNPPTGANTLEFSGSNDGGGYNVGVFCLDNVKQTGTFGNSADSGAVQVYGASTIGATINITEIGSFIFNLSYNNQETSVTWNQGQSVIHNSPGYPPQGYVISSGKISSATGNLNLSYTAPRAGVYGIYLLEILEEPLPLTTSKFFQLF